MTARHARRRGWIGVFLTLCLLLPLAPPAVASPGAGAAPSGPGDAPGLQRRVAPDKPARATVPPGHARDRIHLKFLEGTSVRLRGSRFVSLADDDMAGLAEVLRRHPGVRAERLFQRSEVVLAQEKRRIEARSGREQADKNLYYRLLLGPGTDPVALIHDLHTLDIVEIAYAEPLPAPPPSLPEETPDFTARQGYARPAPRGVDADFAWTVPGGRGEHVKIIDIEYEWNLTHEDLSRAADAEIANGTPKNPFSGDRATQARHHGTAVLGQLIADDDERGVTGLVPDAEIGVVNQHNEERGSDRANAIDLAHRELDPGDVMLLEMQTAGPNGSCGQDQLACAPVEWVPAIYDAIVAATSDGIIVVQAAGNSDQDLDGTEYGRPFPRGMPDSGAIIVGAGGVTACSGQDLARLDFSNHGSRVDLQGDGRCVATTGYGQLQGGGETDEDRWYTGTFSGTSSASPIVAAAAAALSSIAQERGLTDGLTSTEVRTLLQATGSPQRTGGGLNDGNVGPQPNLEAAIRLLDAQLDGPYGIDGLCLPDDGFEPNGTREQAHRLDLGETVSGIMCPSSPEDHYSVRLLAGRLDVELRYDLTDGAHAGRLALRVETEDGDLLGSSDSGSGVERVTVTPAAATDLHIVVAGHDGLVVNGYELAVTPWYCLDGPPLGHDADTPHELTHLEDAFAALCDGGDAHFTVPQFADGWIRVDLSHGLGDGEIELELFDADGRWLTASVPRNAREEIEYRAPADGDYHVVVRNPGEATELQYRIRADVAICPPDDSYAPNHRRADAHLLRSGEAVRGAVCADVARSDHYAIHAFPGASIDLYMQQLAVPEGRSMGLFVTDPAGRWLPSITLEGPDRVSFEIDDTRPAGVYTLQLRADHGASYRFRIDVSACPSDDDFEPNSDPTQAHGLGRGGAIDAVVCAGDRDHFSVEAYAGSQIEFELDQLPDDPPLALRLLDADGTAVTPALPTVDGIASVTHTAAADGGYIAEISGPGGAQSHYRLRASTSMCPPEDAYAPNHTFLTPYAMTSGEEIDAVLCAGTSDYFSFTAVEGRTVRAHMLFPESATSGGLRFEALDQDLEVVATGAAHFYGGHVLQFRSASTGTHLIRVHGVDDLSQGVYRLTVDAGAVCPPDDAFAPNQTIETAADVGVGGQHHAIVCGPEAPDHFAFTAFAGAAVTLGLWTAATIPGMPPPEHDLEVDLIGPEGDVLRSSSDLTLRCTTSGCIWEQLGTPFTHVMEADGRYVVRARTDVEGVHPYRLDIDAPFCPPDDARAPNHTPETAFSLARDADVVGAICHAAPGTVPDLAYPDRDFFTVDLAAGERLQALLTRDVRAGEVDLVLTSPDGETLLEWRADPDGDEVELAHVAAEDGAYVLAVIGHPFVETAYRLAVTVSPHLNDVEPPVVTDLTITPTTAGFGEQITIRATADDLETGASPIVAAEFRVGDGAWTAMDAVVGALRRPREHVVAVHVAEAVGEHEVCVRAEDVAGNLSDPVCDTITVADTAAPVVSGLVLSNEAAGPVSPVELTAVADDRGAGGAAITAVEYRLGDDPWVAMAWDAVDPAAPVVTATASIAPDRADGTSLLCVRASDAHGNTSTPGGSEEAASCTTLRVDATPPAVQDVTVDPDVVAVGSTIEVSATIDDTGRGWSVIRGAGYRVEPVVEDAIGMGEPEDWLVMAASDGSFDTVTEAVTATFTASAEGDHWVCVRGEDALGNAATACTVLTVTGDTPVEPDPEVPTADTSLVSRSGGGVPADTDAEAPSLSADGRFVAFHSAASTLSAAVTTTGRRHVYVHDRQTGATELISATAAGQPANAASLRPAISADGRHVAFESLATDLDAGFPNIRDVFVHDRETGETHRVSLPDPAMSATAANGNSSRASISPDGRYVAFQSVATNLVPGDTNGVTDVFVHDRATGATARASVASDGAEASTHNRLDTDGAVLNSMQAVTSTSGGFVVTFLSAAPELAPDAVPAGSEQVYVHDAATGTTSLVSVTAAGAPSDGVASHPAISADGSAVAFASTAVDLPDASNQVDIFVFERDTGVVERVNLPAPNGNVFSFSNTPRVSADGSRVVFRSRADLTGPTDALVDTYVRDRVLDRTELVSVASDGEPANESSTAPALSGDGRHVAFVTAASNLADDLPPGISQVYVAPAERDPSPPAVSIAVEHRVTVTDSPAVDAISPADPDDPVTDCDATWTGASSDRWDEPQNWSGGAVPGDGATVCVQGPEGLPIHVLDQELSLAGIVDDGSLAGWPLLVLHGEMLQLTGTSSVSGRLEQHGGTLWMAPRAVVGGAGSYHAVGGDAIVHGSIDLAATSVGPGTELHGTGTVTGLHNEGVLVPGGANRGFAVREHYTQGATGRYWVRLAGTTPRSEHTALAVDGTAMLGGHLEVTLDSGYLPDAGDEFVVLAAETVTGTFDTVSLPPLGDTLAMEVDHRADAVVLVVTAAGGPDGPDPEPDDPEPVDEVTVAVDASIDEPIQLSLTVLEGDEDADPIEQTVTVRFVDGDGSGDLRAARYDGSPPDADLDGVTLLDGYVDLSVDDDIGFGHAEVCLSYTEDELDATGVAEEDLRLFHFPDGEERFDRTTDGDPDEQMVCGETDRFSPFAIGEVHTDPDPGSPRVIAAVERSERSFDPGVALAVVARERDLDPGQHRSLENSLGAPVLLLADDHIPVATRTELRRLDPEYLYVIIGGGIPAGVLAELEDLVDGTVEHVDAHHDVRRLAFRPDPAAPPRRSGWRASSSRHRRRPHRPGLRRAHR